MELVSRKEAIARGLGRYFTGIPCSRNHITERFAGSSVCVECNAYHAKKRWKEKKDEYRQKRKKWGEQNKDKIYLRNKKWKSDNKEKVSQSSKTYYEENKERLKQVRNAYRDKNKEKIRKYVSDWQKANRERKNKTRNEWRKEKLKSDPFFCATEKIRSITINAFRRSSLKKSKTTETLLGCSVEHAKKHIESKFRNGMTWQNHGAWHIDHIIPLSSAKTIEELERLSHYTNLQPLWAKENLKKGAKILLNPIDTSNP